MAIGVAWKLVSPNEKITLNNFDTRCFNFEFKDDKTTQTYQTFWSKHPEQYEKLLASEKNVWSDFGKFLDEMYILSLKNNAELVLVSDNPAFDLSFIDHHLTHYLNRQSIRYTNTKYLPQDILDAYPEETKLCQYLDVSDPCTALQGYIDSENIQDTLNRLCAYEFTPHDPVSDAVNILCQQLLFHILRDNSLFESFEANLALYFMF